MSRHIWIRYSLNVTLIDLVCDIYYDYSEYLASILHYLLSKLEDSSWMVRANYSFFGGQGGIVSSCRQTETYTVENCTLIAWIMGPTWGPSGADRTQVGPILAPWTLLSGVIIRKWSYWRSTLNERCINLTSEHKLYGILQEDLHYIFWYNW